jgi:crotonobetainyl-CoA:carnitine CoA-transferase CaiB-like acyl-CoA transferase
LGNEHPSIAPYQSLPAKDGHFILAVGNDSQFKSFCHAAGHPELAQDERFITNQARVMNRQALTQALETISQERTIDDWTQTMQKANVPCGPINTLDRVFADPQVQERQLRVNLPHARYGSVPSVANPIRLSQTPIRYEQAPPELGQHNQEVLREWLGLEESRWLELQRQGIV